MQSLSSSSSRSRRAAFPSRAPKNPLPPLPEGIPEDVLDVPRLEPGLVQQRSVIVIPRESKLVGNLDYSKFLEPDLPIEETASRNRSVAGRRVRPKAVPRKKKAVPLSTGEVVVTEEMLWRGENRGSQFARDPAPRLSYSAYFSKNRPAMDRIARQTCPGWSSMWACIGAVCTEHAMRAAEAAKLIRGRLRRRVAYIGCGDSCVLKDIMPPTRSVLIQDPLTVSRTAAVAAVAAVDVCTISDADPFLYRIDEEAGATAAATYDTVVVGMASCFAMTNSDMARTMARNVDELLGSEDNSVVCVLSYDFEVLAELSSFGESRSPFGSVEVDRIFPGMYSIRAGTRFRGSIDAFNQVIIPEADLLKVAMSQVDMSCIARTNVGLLIDEERLPDLAGEAPHIAEWPHLLQIAVYSRSLVP